MKNTGRLLKQASNYLARNFDRFAKQFDLTGMQMSIIDFLSRGDKTEYLQRDIEKEFHIQRSTTSVLLHRMEKKNLVARSISSQDARQKSVALTEKAQVLAKECQLYFQNQEKIFENTFSEEERFIFHNILNYYQQQK